MLLIAFKKADVVVQAAHFDHAMEYECCLYLVYEFGEVSWSNCSSRIDAKFHNKMSRPGSRPSKSTRLEIFRIFAKPRHIDNVPYC